MHGCVRYGTGSLGTGMDVVPKLLKCPVLEFRSSGDDCARPKSLDEEIWSQTLADDGLRRLARSRGLTARAALMM